MAGINGKHLYVEVEDRLEGGVYRLIQGTR